MRLHATIRFAAAALTAVVLSSCQTPDIDIGAITQSYRDHIAQMPRTPQPRLARPTGSTTRPALTETGLESRQPTAGIVRLSLQDVLHRALANSLDIQVESYSPGIAAQDVIVAEAAFDTVFFLESQYSKLDDPVNSSALGGGQSETRSLSGGFKKRLVTGGEISVKYGTSRIWSQQLYQRFNPHYETDATLELRHSLLQNFGTDVNKAQIRINSNRRDISLYEFRRQVIDTLARVEQAYWTLYFARQSLAVGQELLARTERTYTLVVQRLQWDALPVNVSQVRSAVATRRAAVIRQIADVKDAEDQLKNLLNDPTLPQSADIALVPTDEPMTVELDIDPQQQLLAGLEHRPELEQARLNISNANIVRAVAQNQLLPKLDVFAQWNLAGLHKNFPTSDEQVLHGDFQDYVVGLSFEFPLGNRAANAQVRKSKLQQDQAVSAYRNAVADVMTQVQIAIRDVQTSYREIVANQEAVAAATENLSALIARRERLSPEYLDLELSTQQTQSNARRALLAALANYNVAIVRLEQAKGTLLHYDRVELAPDR